MQKWIRDRMRRRKKKTTEGTPTTTEATPPLQPIYPESDTEADSQPEANPPAEVNEAVEPTQVQAERTGTRRRRKKRTPKKAESAEGAAVDVAEDVPAAAEDQVEPPATEEPEAAEAEASSRAEAAQVAAPSAPVAAAPPVAAPAPAQHQQKGRSSKGAVVLAVGLPGSGKSTWFKRHSVTPLSSDMVRHLLFDNATEQRYQDLVFGTLRSLLRARLIAKMPMNYVDATNLSPKERRHWIRMAKDFGYEAHAVYFDVPLEVCMQRNERRNRVVPEDVMHRMSAKLRPPTFDEGFSKIVVVRVKPKAEGSPVGEAAGEQ